MNLSTLILGSLRYRPGRSLATLFCFALIAANIFSAQYLIAGAVGNVDQGISRMGADVIVIPAQYALLIRGTQMGPITATGIIRVEPSTFRISSDILDSVGKVPGISNMSPQLFVLTQTLPELSLSPVDIYGIDPATDFTIRPWLQQPSEKMLGPGEVYAGDGIRGEVLSRISVSGRQYTIAGKLDPTRSAIDHSLFLRMDDAYALAAAEEAISPQSTRVVPGFINAVLVKASPDADPGMVGAKIQQPFSTSSIKVVGRNFALEPVSQEVRGLPNLLNMISAIVIFASLPLIAMIAAMVAHERQREIGLLRAMGAKRKVIFSLMMAESLILSAVGGILGSSISLAVFMLAHARGFSSIALLGSFRMPSPGTTVLMAALAVFVVIIVGSIAAFWPAYQSSTMTPYDAIRRE
jgi:putative ABC transport system permease protein